MGPIGGALIGAVGSVAGGVAGGKGAAKAAQIQAQQQEANRALAKQFYADAQTRYQPDINRGEQYSTTIQALLGLGGDQNAANNAFKQFQNSSGYQYGLNQGLDAVNSNAYASGLGQSGAVMKALQDRGNALAQQSIGNYLGQLGNQQLVGENAKNAITNAGSQQMTAITNANNQQAQSAGNAALTQGSIWNNVFNQLGTIGGNVLGKSSYSPGGGGTPQYQMTTAPGYLKG